MNTGSFDADIADVTAFPHLATYGFGTKKSGVTAVAASYTEQGSERTIRSTRALKLR